MTINQQLRKLHEVEKQYLMLPDNVKARSSIQEIRTTTGESLAYIETLQQKPSQGRTGKSETKTDTILRY